MQRKKKAGGSRTAGWIALGVLCLTAAGILFLRRSAVPDYSTSTEDTDPASEGTALQNPAISGVYLPAFETAQPESTPTPTPGSSIADPVTADKQPAGSTTGGAVTQTVQVAPQPEADSAQPTATPVQPSAATSVQTASAQIQSSVTGDYHEAPTGENETPRF